MSLYSDILNYATFSSFQRKCVELVRAKSSGSYLHKTYYLEYLLLHFLKEIDLSVENSSNLLELVTELPKVKVLKNGSEISL